MTFQETISSMAGTDEAPAIEVLDPLRTRQIAICGSNPHTVNMAPFTDPAVQIYCCSPDNSPYGFADHAKALPRVDLSFELHDPVFDRSRPYAYLDWLRNVPKVYMRDRVALNMRTESGEPLFPNAALYPEDRLRGVLETQPILARRPNGKPVDAFVRGTIQKRKVGKFSPFHFTSSIAYMMAFAIDACDRDGIGEIGLYGILQQSKTEYDYQRPGIQYFIWEAERRGIKVLAPDVSMLFEPMPDTW
jgi:hypothetical protein